ncbi:hypothetical protein [Euzebya pacifica]|uniref:hypothetical protein n=1 Tax=Euzebya pacifica TaxID=1608957 RepID=UPI0030F6AB79
MTTYLTQRDSELLGTSNRTDALGHLSIWSEIGRELIPHLTAQTTDVRAFQVLIEILRLWERLVSERPEHAGRLRDVFVLMEQAIARTVALRGLDWPLPGARRVRAGATRQVSRIGLDPDHALLGSQFGNGIYGLYVASARRAGMVTPDHDRLEIETLEVASSTPGLSEKAAGQLIALVRQVLENGGPVDLPTHGSTALVGDVVAMYEDVPLGDHLRQKLVGATHITAALAARTLATEGLPRRGLLSGLQQDISEHADQIQRVIDTEDTLAIIEATFVRLCAGAGEPLGTVASSLPVDLGLLREAHDRFVAVGPLRGGAARLRHGRISTMLDMSTAEAFARSILHLHHLAMDDRRRADWVTEENGILRGFVEIGDVDDDAFNVGQAWWNDYYLYAYTSISRQLADLSS